MVLRLKVLRFPLNAETGSNHCRLLFSSRFVLQVRGARARRGRAVYRSTRSFKGADQYVVIAATRPLGSYRMLHALEPTRHGESLPLVPKDLQVCIAWESRSVEWSTKHQPV